MSSCDTPSAFEWNHTLQSDSSTSLFLKIGNMTSRLKRFSSKRRVVFATLTKNENLQQSVKEEQWTILLVFKPF